MITQHFDRGLEQNRAVALAPSFWVVYHFTMLSLFLLALCVVVPASLAGRAFPVDSEGLATKLFQELNPDITKDPTNFLTDLSGQYAVCDRLYERQQIKVNRRGTDGSTIGGLVDYIEGSRSNVGAVTGYIDTMLRRWKSRGSFVGQISRADFFGCSVEPACQGRYAVVACLFSPEYSSDEGNKDDINAGKTALAFTPEQYSLTEDFLGVTWDRSYLLENLSGKETECGMISQRYWDFKKAKDEGKLRGLTITGLFGYSPNLGSTQQAMSRILTKWTKKSFKKMGCSVIPDCKVPGNTNGMDVVLSCLFLER